MVIKQTIFLVVYLVSVKSNSEERMLNKEIIDNILASKIPFAVRRAYYINIKELRKELLEATNDSKPIDEEFYDKIEKEMFKRTKHKLVRHELEILVKIVIRHFKRLA